jgi:hypothetical protein
LKKFLPTNLNHLRDRIVMMLWDQAVLYLRGTMSCKEQEELKAEFSSPKVKRINCVIEPGMETWKPTATEGKGELGFTVG